MVRTAWWIVEEKVEVTGSLGVSDPKNGNKALRTVYHFAVTCTHTIKLVVVLFGQLTVVILGGQLTNTCLCQQEINWR